MIRAKSPATEYSPTNMVIVRDTMNALYGSANRDERHYPDPMRFDITRRPSDHLAFGRGEHVCPGMHLARLEIGVLLERLADRVARFAILESRPMINNGLRGLEYLEVAVEPVTGTG